MDQPLQVFNVDDSAGNYSNISTDAFDQFQLDQNILFTICSVLFVIIGFVAATMNFTILAILAHKKKKMASELLVLANLIIDGCYGVVLVIVGVLNVTEFDKSRFFRIKCLNCIISKVPPTFLIFASLFLVLVNAFNRFMAVKYPTRYKNVFRPQLVRTYLFCMFAISALLATVDFGICVADPWGLKDFSEYYSVIWIYAKFALVMVACFAMVLVYKLIAKQFSRAFWAPIALPFTVWCCQSNNDDTCSQLAVKNKPAKHNVHTYQSKLNVNFSNDRKGCQSNRQSNSNNVEQIVNKERKMSGFLTVQAEDGDAIEVLTTETKTDVELMSSKDANIEHESKGAVKTRKTRKRLTLHQRKHYVTTMFFFVSIVFLAVSLPSSISNLVDHIFHDKLPITFLYHMYLVTETLYGINFVLNPYLFSFNNSYLKDRLTQTFLVKSLYAFLKKN